MGTIFLYSYHQIFIRTKEVAFNFIKKETLAQVFSCEFCEIFKNTIFHTTPLLAASVCGDSKIIQASKGCSRIMRCFSYIESRDILIELVVTFTLLIFSSLSWRRLLSYRNQSIDFLCKSLDWPLYDYGLRHERVKDMCLRIVYVNCKTYFTQL